MGPRLCLSQNDTHTHRPLKNYYQNSECVRMIKKLQAHENKVLSSTRDVMMSMLAYFCSLLTVDSTHAFKSFFVTNALYRSEDHLVSEKRFLLSFRTQHLTQQHLETLEGVVRKLISPKGIKRKEFEETEFFTDFTDPGEAEVVSEGEESEMSDTDVTPYENVNETDTVNQTPFRTVVLQGTVLLQNIVYNPDINEDAKLLDYLSSIIGDAEISIAFMSYM